jgi:hypothetical protein
MPIPPMGLQQTPGHVVAHRKSPIRLSTALFRPGLRHQDDFKKLRNMSSCL